MPQEESKTTRRNEQTRCSLGVSITKQHETMGRLLKRAVNRVKNMSPQEREAMHKAQSESWTRQDND